MNTSTKRFLVIIIIALVILNITTLGIIIFKAKTMQSNFAREKFNPPSEMHDMNDFPNRISRILDFNEEQSRQVEQLTQKHHLIMEELYKAMRFERRELLEQALQPSGKTDEIIENIINLQREMEKSKIEHLQGIASLCTPSQLEKFKSVMSRVANREEAPQRKMRRGR